jgi:hypothetical protein
MKILKMTTHWSAEEADCVDRLLSELQTALWESYGDDIERLYQTHREEQLQLEMEWEQERETGPLDEIPF